MKNIKSSTKTLIILASLILPLTLTSCATDDNNTASKEATIKSFIEIAKINAARDGQDLNLNYIMQATEDSSADYETFKNKEIPEFEQKGEAITATFEDGSTCGVTIKAGTILINCA